MRSFSMPKMAISLLLAILAAGILRLRSRTGVGRPSQSHPRAGHATD